MTQGCVFAFLVQKCVRKRVLYRSPNVRSRDLMPCLCRGLTIDELLAVMLCVGPRRWAAPGATDEANGRRLCYIEEM